ncbi:hypothetical protein [Methylobacterium sp. Leaf118]|uniref:hypothetical protein n=1 Tax=Methylobacterium sp. Leaf118 TaxID=2876562 RepID=UPI001E5D89E0|nr:hypothetical protein [Methylobacterium sp. Leaf118]
MMKLKPAYLYQLRLVSYGPRFYARRHAIRYLEKLGYLQPTGRERAEDRTLEYAITEAGQQALAAASEQSKPE